VKYFLIQTKNNDFGQPFVYTVDQIIDKKQLKTEVQHRLDNGCNLAQLQVIYGKELPIEPKQTISIKVR